MSATQCNSTLPQTSEGFDLFRLSKSKEIVDVSPNTLRAFNRAKPGLPFYKTGKASRPPRGTV